MSSTSCVACSTEENRFVAPLQKARREARLLSITWPSYTASQFKERVDSLLQVLSESSLCIPKDGSKIRCQVDCLKAETVYLERVLQITTGDSHPAKVALGFFQTRIDGTIEKADLNIDGTIEKADLTIAPREVVIEEVETNSDPIAAALTRKDVSQELLEKYRTVTSCQERLATYSK